MADSTSGIWIDGERCAPPKMSRKDLFEHLTDDSLLKYTIALNNEDCYRTTTYEEADGKIVFLVLDSSDRPSRMTVPITSVAYIKERLEEDKK
jgi:hypothetical protein